MDGWMNEGAMGGWHERGDTHTGRYVDEGRHHKWATPINLSYLCLCLLVLTLSAAHPTSTLVTTLRGRSNCVCVGVRREKNGGSSGRIILHLYWIMGMTLMGYDPCIKWDWCVYPTCVWMMKRDFKDSIYLAPRGMNYLNIFKPWAILLTATWNY